MLKRVGIVIAVGIIFSALITFMTNGINGEKENFYKTGRQVIIENDKYKVMMDVEQFVPCVLMAQLDVNSPLELLKAQAVVIRTYILYCMGNNDKISSKELGLPYYSYSKMQEMWFEEFRRENAATGWGMFYNFTGLGKTKVFDEKMQCIHKVMEKTKGKVMKYNGKIVLPLFHQISNGETRDGEKLIGSEYKYLKSIKCKNYTQVDDYIGIKFYTIEEFIDILSKNGIVIYKDKKEKFEYNESDVHELISIMDFSNIDEKGYQLWIKIGDTKINGDIFQKALNLRSTTFKIEEYEQGIRITTRGYGHGFGMSISYAEALAREGAGWKDILRKFYDCVIVDF